MDLTKLTAYDVIEQKNLKDLKAEGVLLRHSKSGARILLLANDDDNKVFSIGFRTPVSDSTGVPHILEHSVLCGSEKFPVKDPFVELAKGSMNTFLNAMTYPDRTIFPVASCNEKDFQNLMDVYMDAVLHPDIYRHEEIFRQEGWSCHLEDADGELSYNGVVYNEMKGVFSSPDDVLNSEVLKSLFPDTTYGHESGGDPAVIPTLTYEAYLDFHRTYYHPSNSYIYLYGDMDMEEKLEWLDREYLSKYDRKDIDSEIHLQEPFTVMRDVTGTYAVGADDPVEGNAFLAYSKVIGNVLDPKLHLAFQVLDYALLSAPGAPIMMALLQSGIGKDIAGSYDSNYYQPVFSVVAKYADAEQKDMFVAIIEAILQDMAENGMDKKALAAGINYYEFRFREADYGGFPKGLIYGMQMMESWAYDDAQPFMHVEALDNFEFLKSQIDTGYFESLIRTYLLDNPHGSVVTILPEPGKTAKMDEVLRNSLQEYKASLSQEEIERLVADTRHLEDYQEEVSAEEDLEKIPMLTREDIPTEIVPLVNQEMTLAGVPVVFHEIETNGIGYLNLMFDLAGVPEELLPYVTLLENTLGMIDTVHYDYGELYNEINVHTGGIETTTEVYPDVTKVREKAYRAFLEIRARALYDQIPFAIQMMQEMILGSKLDDENRLREILDMTMAQQQMKFMSEGHSIASVRAMSYSSPIARFRDMTSGIEFDEFTGALLADFDTEKENIIRKLQMLGRLLFRKGNMLISYTASAEGLRELETAISGLNEALYPEQEITDRAMLSLMKKNEGFKSSSQVQYVAQAGNFADAGFEYSGVLQVLKVIMAFDYLWLNIRMKGGAYGCAGSFNRIGESFFVSYRDPNLANTLAVYADIPEYLRRFDAGERDMTKYIIGTISNLDQPLSPSLQGERSMTFYLNHVSEAMLRKEREEILSASAEDIRALAKLTEAVLAADQICVIGNETEIEECRKLFMNVEQLF